MRNKICRLLEGRDAFGSALDLVRGALPKDRARFTSFRALISGG